MTRQAGRKCTIFDLKWPDTPEFVSLVREYRRDAIGHMLATVWEGYFLLIQTMSSVDASLANEELERAITQLLEALIQKCLTGDEPYSLQHGPYEFATRVGGKAQPPQYDMAFVLNANRRVMWPLEAKVLRSDRTVHRYVKEVLKEFATGRYAPYSSSGAMLGYLMKGAPTRVIQCLEDRLGPLEPVEGQECICVHYVSFHDRNLPSGFVSGRFCCHHLIMPMT